MWTILRGNFFTKSIVVEAENLMFIVIEEKDDTQGEKKMAQLVIDSNQNTESTEEIIYNFMEQALQIQNARSRIELQRVHAPGRESEK